MIQPAAFHLAKVFFRMFLRDRQAIFFSLFFPIIFLSVLGFMGSRAGDPIPISIADYSAGELSGRFISRLSDNPLFEVTIGEEQTLRAQLIEGEETLVMVIPANFSVSNTATELIVYVDAAQVRLLGLIMPALEKALVDVERTLRGIEPMFTLKVEDVQSRSQRYIDFLLPGIIAFTLMQISIAGSGYNIVEYRRKGILKRLFVTPIRPGDFIAAICMARLGWALMQLTVLLLVAVFLLDVSILGNYLSLYLIIILGTMIFLCLGFCIGSLAKTQQAVGAIGSVVTFPQLILSGVFFPIDVMPEMIQPLARLLPLSSVVNCLREIANNGLSIIEFLPDFLGVMAWIVISFMLATRLFVWKEVVK